MSEEEENKNTQSKELLLLPAKQIIMMDKCAHNVAQLI